MTAWFRYARHEDAPALAATGLWCVIAPLPGGHGAYAVLMQWCGETDPAPPALMAAE